jgi:hypothetical protein
VITEEGTTMTETVTVRAADLRLLMQFATTTAPLPGGEQEQVNAALARCGEALEAAQDSAGESPEPSLPPGRYARVEIPGFRQNTGWVTEEARYGAQCAVVRDWNGAVEAEVVIGPGSRVVYLPVPLKRPEPMTALPAGDDEEEPDVGDWAYDEGGEGY